MIAGLRKEAFLKADSWTFPWDPQYHVRGARWEEVSEEWKTLAWALELARPQYSSVEAKYNYIALDESARGVILFLDMWPDSELELPSSLEASEWMLQVALFRRGVTGRREVRFMIGLRHGLSGVEYPVQQAFEDFDSDADCLLHTAEIVRILGIQMRRGDFK